MEKNIYSQVFDYLFDSKIKFFNKFIVILLIFLGLFFFNNAFEITENIYLKHKIEQTKGLNEILKDSLQLTKPEVNKLKELRKKIISKKYIFDTSFFLTKGNKIAFFNSNIKIKLWYSIFAILLPAILLILFVLNYIMSIFTKDFRKNFTLKELKYIIIMLILLISSIYGSYYFSWVFPVIFKNNLWINYTVNIFIGFTFLYLIVNLIDLLKKKRII